MFKWLTKPWKLGFYVCSAWVLVWLLAVALEGDWWARMLSEWSWVLMQAFAVAACWRIVAAKTESKQARVAWGLIGLSAALSAVGDLIYSGLSLGESAPPFPSLADVFFLVSYPVQFFGQLFLPAEKLRKGDVWRIALDLTVVATVGLVGVWDAIIRPLAVMYADDWTALTFTVGPLVGDILLLAGVTVMLMRRPKAATGEALLLLSVTIIAYIVSDIVYFLTMLTDTYKSGAISDLGWIIAPVFIGLAALRQQSTVQGKKSRVADMALVIVERSGMALPLVAITFGFSLIIPSISDQASVITVIGATVLCGLILIRQTYSALQNAKLSKALEASNLWLTAERAKADRLLLNVLPVTIAARLKDGKEKLIAETFENVSVLFADIVGFTPMASKMTPAELVTLLNKVFSLFDELAERHNLEKIKTIGDAYMVAGGVPIQQLHQTAAVARMAIDMCDSVQVLAHDLNLDLNVRIGIHCGTVVAGVIGTQKFSYDIWGATVNTASRMESHGVPGKIHVTAEFRDQLKDAFVFESRGPVEIKGLGQRETFFLIEEKEVTTQSVSGMIAYPLPHAFP